ncbi:hypothetical protein OTU49_002379 [Cherax quadricarinatus]|uniref:Endonuclease/exonuclease/phosphatase domain-containing protein n=2 Tax=Cherax quadricarinatus TaxID=27406 RepID=A0AAW0XMZ7_CHEQU
MSTCMHCLLPTRVLYKASRAACGIGGAHISQVRDGVYQFLWINPDSSFHTVSLGKSHYSTYPHTPGACHHFGNDSSQRTETSQNAVVKEEASKKFENVKLQLSSVNPIINELSEMNSKRNRDLLSPVRPLPQKRIKSGSSSSKKFSESAVLDYIPLPPSPQEKDELGDFFVIDTRPSEVNFPETNRNKCNSEKSKKDAKVVNGKKSSSNKKDSVGGESSGGCSGTGTKYNKKVIVSCDNDVLYIPSTSKFCEGKLHGKRNNNRTKKRTKVLDKNYEGSSARTSGKNDIDILFEVPGKSDLDDVMVLCTIVTPDKSQDHVLSPGKSLVPDNQTRKCHTSTRQQLKTKLRDIQPDEVISVPSNLEIKGGKTVPDYKNRDVSSGIQKVDVVDPDVLEIEALPASSSKTSVDVEVIDVFASDEDKCSTDSSDHEERNIDVSTSEFVSLQKLRVKDLQNTVIDISDEVLKFRRELEQLRKWEMTGLGREILSSRNMKPSDTMFTIMSYNVLAQALLTDNMLLYSSCNDEHLSWEYRWALLQHEITDLDPDVLLLQEVQASHYHSHYLPWFTFQGYDSLYKKRTGTKADGCAIFFKKSKFSLIESSSIEYLQPEALNILDRDNVGLIAKLSPVLQPDAPALCVATTHLLYNKKRHDVKLAQIILFLSEIDRLCYEGEEGGRPKYCPVIVTGDFNAEPHSALIQFLKDGRLQYEGLARKTLTRHGAFGELLGPELFPPSLGLTDRCQHAVLAQSRYLEQSRGPIFSLADKRKLEESLIHLYHSDRQSQPPKNLRSTCIGPTPSGWFSHGFNFHSVYRHYLSRLGRAPEATTNHNGWTSVDYMLYSRSYSSSLHRPIEGNLKLLARYGLLSGPEADRFAPLPSAVCPSDHFPLAAQFLLRR